MHLTNKNKTQQNVQDNTAVQYKLYNLLFAGKISLPEYFKALKSL